MVKYREDIKLLARYILLAYLTYMCHYVLEPETLTILKGMSDIVGGAAIASPFGALTLVIKSHFGTSINKDHPGL